MTHKPTKQERAIFGAYHAKLRRETIRAAFLQAKGRAISARLDALKEARKVA